jgi:hypothetical protein
MFKSSQASRTANRLYVELECGTVGKVGLLNTKRLEQLVLQFLLCGPELWSTSEYPTVSLLRSLLRPQPRLAKKPLDGQHPK